MIARAGRPARAFSWGKRNFGNSLAAARLSHHDDACHSTVLFPIRQQRLSSAFRTLLTILRETPASDRERKTPGSSGGAIRPEMDRSPVESNQEEDMIERVIARPYVPPILTVIVIAAGVTLAFW